MIPGEPLGPYRIVGELGAGGMAAVYVAEHDVLGHRVAIKVIHPRYLDNPRAAQRFVNEARAVAEIRHPGIVELYDFGRADDGRAYIVMELLAGETLADRMKGGPLPIEQAIIFGRQIASAVGAAHERGIVHRDLKPANVFLVSDPDVPGGERAKILDFGIAKRTTHAPTEEITGTGMLIGTPMYMSPEQCRGDRDIDGRSDIYTLGVLLYQMVTGRQPFEETNTNELLSRQLYERARPVVEVNRAVPPALGDVIDRCLEKERLARFDSMAEVSESLAAVPIDDDDTGPTSVALIRQPSVAAEIVVAAAPPTPGTLTLTRTIVDQPSWLARVRRRSRAAVAAIASAAVASLAALVVVAFGPAFDVAVAPAFEGRSSPRHSAPGRIAPASEVGAPAACEVPNEPTLPALEVVRRGERPAPRAEEQPRDERRARGRSPRKVRHRSKPAKPAAPTRPPEDPFADVSTPTVY